MLCRKRPPLLPQHMKVFLLKKIDSPLSTDDLRGIGIIPAFLMTLKKLVLPIIESFHSPRLSKHQYGSVKGMNTTLAKFTLLFNAKHKGYQKNALIDLKKAYDSVNRARLNLKLSSALYQSDFAELIRLIIIFDHQLCYSKCSQIN